MATAISLNFRTLSGFAAERTKALGLTIGNFFYGDEIRTRRSLTFAYLSISLYLLSVINFDKYAACAL